MSTNSYLHFLYIYTTYTDIRYSFIPHCCYRNLYIFCTRITRTRMYYLFSENCITVEVKNSFPAFRISTDRRDVLHCVYCEQILYRTETCHKTLNSWHIPRFPLKHHSVWHYIFICQCSSPIIRVSRTCPCMPNHFWDLIIFTLLFFFLFVLLTSSLCFIITFKIFTEAELK